MPARITPATAACLVLALTNCSPHSKTLPQETNQYVNPRQCATCHAAIYETYRHTGMARAFYPPSPDSASRPYFHKSSNTWYQNIQKEGAFYQRTWQIGFSGQPDSIQDLKIDYIMGSGNHVRTYLHRTARNTLVELPLAWYAENGGTWALNPGFDTAQPPIGRKIGYDCMFCHNSYPSIPDSHDAAGSEPVFTATLSEGIDCQRCHGPGANHIRDARAGSIVNPKKLSAPLSMQVCEQCHLETTSAPLPNVVRRYDRGPFSYRPGEPLSNFVLFFDQAGHDDKFEIVSSAYRLKKSQCFIKSQGALQCTTCHNPHDIPHGPIAAAHYNGVCRQCHAVIKVAAHPQNPNCVSCHMPKRRTEDVVHGIMTDHLIQRRPPAKPLADMAERHDPYRGEVIPYGAADPLYTAVAQVAQKSNLDAGIPRLIAALAQHPVPEAYLELGDAYCNTNRCQMAIEPYQLAISGRPNSALFLRRLANAYRSSGQPQQALDALLRATQTEPANAESWYDLGLLQAGPEAIQSLRHATELDPELADAQNSLGAVFAETGQADAAEAAFRAALRIRPSFPMAHANLANLLASKNQLAEAVWHYAQASASAADQFNYGVTLARMNKLAEAQTHLEAAIKADPNLAEAHDVLGGILETHGQSDAALAQYREAVRLRPGFGKAHLDLGVALANHRDFAGAAEEFRKAAADADPEIRQQAAGALKSLSH